MTTTGDAVHAIDDVVHVINRAHQHILSHGDSRLFDVIGKICDGPYADECAYALATTKTAGVWFAHACGRKRWPLMRWLLFVYGGPSARHAQSAFSMACASGHESIARWLIDTFWPGAEEIDHLIYVASDRGVFRLTKQLFTRYTPYFRAQATLVDHMRYVFASACKHRCIWFIRWLDRTYGLTVDDVCHYRMEAYTAACAGGHWPLVRWMTIRFGLTRKHIRDSGCDPLTSACSHGQLHVARWLVESFRLTVRDVRHHNNATFRSACCHGRLEVARWLADRFHLTTRDACSEHNTALIVACYDGHTAVAQWLVERFGLGRDGARVEPVYMLVRITETAGVALKWLIALFGARRHKKAGAYSVLIDSTIEDDRVWFARWMVKRFGIIPYDVKPTLDAHVRPAHMRDARIYDAEHDAYIADPEITKQQAARAQRWFDAFAAEWLHTVSLE